MELHVFISRLMCNMCLIKTGRVITKNIMEDNNILSDLEDERSGSYSVACTKFC